MKLSQYTVIRTGLVLSRKEAPLGGSRYKYRALALKNVTDDGTILLTEVENYHAIEALKGEYLTHVGDVLLRLSAPYTTVLITEEEADLLIPAHFAVIRTGEALDPCYLHWWLSKNRKWFYQIAGGGTMMGTISSGYVADMPFAPPSLDRQRQAARLCKLANREQRLLSMLLAKKKRLVDATLAKITTH